ncbi:hypothetical protein KFU94_41425 [Chloroflexi bacterium TSY]|nr:hypothetical protein [Chloroflexi bacterium TSY]
MAESQDRTDRQIARLIAAQERMDSDIKELKYDVSVLKEDMRGVKEDVSVLKEDMHGVKNELSSLRGSALETRYTRNAHGYFSRWLRKIRVVLPLNSYSSFEDLLEEKPLEEIRDVLLLDLIVRGRAPQLPEHSEVYLAVEVSAVIDRTDVDRARKRAGLMRKADLFTLPVVAGENLRKVHLSMESTPVLVLQNGKTGVGMKRWQPLSNNVL